MKKIRPYLQVLPDILVYQIIIHICVAIFSLLFEIVFSALLKSDGRVALSGNDALFLVTTWQGWLIMLLFVALLFVYVTFELGTMIIFFEKRIKGFKYSIWRAIKDAVFSMKKLLSPRGILIVLFIAFVLPLVGAGVSISITQNMYIPHFIQSVIDSTPLYSIGYTVLLLVLTVVAAIHIFSLHALLSDEVDDKDAFKVSRKLFIKNIGNFILESVLFFVISFLIYALVAAVTFAIPAIIVSLTGLGNRIVILFFVILLAVEGLGIVGVTVPLYIMKLTQLFNKYRSAQKVSYPVLKKQHTVIKDVAICAFVLFSIGSLTLLLNMGFDVFFPSEVSAGIVAHRAGGVEAPENTVAGIEKAIEYGAVGAEIDIHRTKDGYYVINHDANFMRVAGDERAPKDMTLEEVKTLRVEGKEPVATLEEMLDASKGRIKLFVELKGETADTQMADDAVRIINLLCYIWRNGGIKLRFFGY